MVCHIFLFLCFLYLFLFRLELWPGYTTSIMPYETDVLLSADVSHKVLRQTTVLEFLYELYNSGRARNFYDEACKQLIGQIVLTRYRRLYSHFLSLSIVFLAFFASVVFQKSLRII